MKKFPKILLIGSLPFAKNNSSRPLFSYFGEFPKKNLRMIYSNSSTVFSDELCDEMYQITDSMLVKAFFSRKATSGRILKNYSQTNTSDSKKEKSKLDKLITIFKKKNVFRFYLRKLLWKKKRWLTEKLERWVSDFKPDFIYICFSDDLYILEIAYYFSEKIGIPIICQVGDDYYFHNEFEKNIFFKPYFKKYKNVVDKIFKKEGFAIYIGEEICNLYNRKFLLQGFPFYVNSFTTNYVNSSIISSKMEFNYFGKINNGRYRSLALLGKNLTKSFPNAEVNVFAIDEKARWIRILKRNGCLVHKSIPYEEVLKLMNGGGFNVIASGLKQKEIIATKYSLTTKIADCLSSNGNIIAVGNKSDGAIKYLIDNNCAIVIDEKFNQNIIDTITSEQKLSELRKNMNVVYNNNHNLFTNREKFYRWLEKYYGNRF